MFLCTHSSSYAANTFTDTVESTLVIVGEDDNDKTTTTTTTTLRSFTISPVIIITIILVEGEDQQYVELFRIISYDEYLIINGYWG